MGNKWSKCAMCLMLFYSTMFMQYAYSNLYTECECVLNIVLDNDLSYENFAAIERETLTYDDIEEFKHECTEVANNNEKIRISALAEAMYEYLYKTETSCCMTGSKDGKTLKRLYLKELNRHSKNIF